jgi:hypothetical protein
MAFLDDDNVAEGYRVGMAEATFFQNDGSRSGFSVSSSKSNKENETVASNNVNGPGSGSVRNYQYTVRKTPHNYPTHALTLTEFLPLHPSLLVCC